MIKLLNTVGYCDTIHKNDGTIIISTQKKIGINTRSVVAAQYLSSLYHEVRGFKIFRENIE